MTIALEQAIRKARRTTGTRGDLLCGLSVDRHTEDARRTADDIGQILDAVIIQAIRDAKTIAQGACEHARARGGTHECETRDIQANRAGSGPLADNDIEGEVLHRRVQDLLDLTVEAMNLIDEQDVARLQVGENRREVARASDGGP